MKYLKVFEEYNDKLYHEITEGEWNEAVGFDSGDEMGFEKFTESEINDIRMLLDKRADISINERHAYIINIDISSPSGDGWSFTKIRDEWYYVADKNEFLFYKCDTFEGLINYIEEMFPMLYLK